MTERSGRIKLEEPIRRMAGKRGTWPRSKQTGRPCDSEWRPGKDGRMSPPLSRKYVDAVIIQTVTKAKRNSQRVSPGLLFMSTGPPPASLAPQPCHRSQQGEGKRRLTVRTWRHFQGVTLPERSGGVWAAVRRRF